MSRRDPGLHIGLSGWSYPSWRDGFYRGVPQRGWLAHCAAQFDSVEANGTFYRLPRAEMLRSWRDATPADFLFVAKGHRWVTHMKRLKEARPSVLRQRDAMRPLGRKLAVVLWQLPEDFRRDDDRLAGFLAALRLWRGPRHAVELRHRSWFCAPVAAMLERARIANCISDASRWPMWDAVTTDLVYVRLHGHSVVYASRYSTPGLRRWAARIRGWRGEGRSVHVYFDNDARGHAPWDALRLKALLGDV